MTNEDFEGELKRRAHIRSLGFEFDENGKRYMPLPEPLEPIDKSQLIGLAAALDFVYGDKE
jgi:hypothetical protein